MAEIWYLVTSFIYRYPISWEAFLDPSDSYFLFADLVGFYFLINFLGENPLKNPVLLYSYNFWHKKSELKFELFNFSSNFSEFFNVHH